MGISRFDPVLWLTQRELRETVEMASGLSMGELGAHYSGEPMGSPSELATDNCPLTPLRPSGAYSARSRSAVCRIENSVILCWCEGDFATAIRAKVLGGVPNF
jgi:hypothetical protein